MHIDRAVNAQIFAFHTSSDKTPEVPELQLLVTAWGHRYPGCVRGVDMRDEGVDEETLGTEC